MIWNDKKEADPKVSLMQREEIYRKDRTGNA